MLNLQAKDKLTDRGLIHIHQSKGKKDQIVPLSPLLLEQLRTYYRIYRPKKYIFEGDIPGTMCGARSLQLVLKRSVARVGIEKPLTLH